MISDEHRTIREHLANPSARAKRIPMEKVYQMLDSGKSVKEAAAAFNVSKSTLYNCHAKYQASYQSGTVEDILRSITDRGSDNYCHRSTLADHKRAKKYIDMEDVYKKLDTGETVKNVAESLNVSVSTLRRRHLEYQEQ